MLAPRLAAAAAAMAAAAAKAPAGDAPLPSFLFILADDIGWADFGYNGGTARARSHRRFARPDSLTQIFFGHSISEAAMWPHPRHRPHSTHRRLGQAAGQHHLPGLPLRRDPLHADAREHQGC